MLATYSILSRMENITLSSHGCNYMVMHKYYCTNYDYYTLSPNVAIYRDGEKDCSCSFSKKRKEVCFDMDVLSSMKTTFVTIAKILSFTNSLNFEIPSLILRPLSIKAYPSKLTFALKSIYNEKRGRVFLRNKNMMKAWFYEEYGPKEVLKLGDFPIPAPQHNQLLIKVRAAALNPIDCKRRQRPIFPSDFPVVPGCDMAGVVVAKGSGVTKFNNGDAVYGNIQDFNAEGKLKQLGTLAEFIVVEESLVATKPKNLSFEEAASLPLAVQTAIEGFKTGGFKVGQNIFVVGGAGGVGTLVIQLAKHLYGASNVVATTSTPKVEFVKILGADKVIDYTKTSYEEIEEKYDFLYDTIGDCKKSFVVAKEDAPIVDITWPPSHPGAVYSSLTVSGENLEKLRPYLENGKLKSLIDPTGPYYFSDVIEAFRHLETGRARGKVVVSGFPSPKSCDNMDKLPPPEMVPQEMPVY